MTFGSSPPQKVVLKGAEGGVLLHDMQAMHSSAIPVGKRKFLDLSVIG